MSTSSAEVRAQLDHPVIDADGHVQEYLPAALPYLREAMGPTVFDRYQERTTAIGQIMGTGSPEWRLERRLPQSAWWATPAANTRDLATAVFPGLLVERMGELGVDYSVLFPTKAFGTAGIDDDELRQGVARGWNDFYADKYGPYSQHLTVGGVIPMHTPEEAIAELEHCHAIGLKVVAMPEGVYRPIPVVDEHRSPFLTPGATHWYDTFGIDSAHDYDAVWAACERLGFAVSIHGGMGHPAPNGFTSPTNYSFNHIGAFAEKNHRLVKSLFMAGVTRRFPGLPIAVLECGVSWGAQLLNDLCEHWEKRNAEGITSLDPARIDWDEFAALAERFGTDLLVPGRDLRADLAAVPAVGVPPADLDDWRALDVASEQELCEDFADHFYFGCEADDRGLVFAFHASIPGGVQLKPIFSSDIGHWDVPDMAETVSEAWELVEDGWLTAEQYRRFTCDNPAELLTRVNPDFFTGTSVEGLV
jgi:predicted TIM-barrel fold metal-dependent hydrolase